MGLARIAGIGAGGGELDDEVLENVCNGLETSLQRTHAQTLRSTTDAFEFQQAHALVQRLISEHSTPGEP